MSGALSEKEREALRLLLAGHDAKSAANQLGISHHAIHDRLRSARQKFGTTSSRQAALLLNQSEKTTPDPMVHKPIGGAAVHHFPDEVVSAKMERRGSSSVHWRKSGLIFMSVSILIVAATLAFNHYGIAPWKYSGANEAPPLGSKSAFSSPAQDQNNGFPPEVTASIQARSIVSAIEFMGLVDQGKSGASYAVAAPAFRNALSGELWELAVAIRATEGGAQRRTLVDFEEDANPANPAFEALEILTFDTVMLNGKQVAERLVMARIDGGWQVVSFDAEEVKKGQ